MAADASTPTVPTDRLVTTEDLQSFESELVNVLHTEIAGLAGTILVVGLTMITVFAIALAVVLLVVV